MQYILSLSDNARNHLVVLTLRESDVKRPAIDVFFDLIGAPAAQLADDGVIAAGQADDLTALQRQIFGEDNQGLYIKDGVTITTNGFELNPDAPFKNAFTQAERDGVPYMRCDAVAASESAAVPGPALSGASVSPSAATGGQGASGASAGLAANGAAVSPGNTSDNANLSLEERVEQFARIWFIWQIGIGFQIDCTKDNPEFAESIAEAEKNGWIDIDVKKASYKLTELGEKLFQQYKAEAQDLIRRYDIYGDVDVDVAGEVRFDTGLGKDLRLAMFEFEGVDPYRARFLIGLNDGEWNGLADWADLYKSQKGYESIMQDVAYAPSLESYDRNLLTRILSEGKAQLRMDQQFNR